MAKGRLRWQSVDSTGEVVGNNQNAPYTAVLHGWLLSNSGAATYQVDFKVEAAPQQGVAPTKPASGGTTKFSVQVPANSSKEFFVEDGIMFEYGVFAIASNAALTGVLLYS